MRRNHYQGPSGVNATRFPLSKLTLNREGVAGLVRLLALPNKDVAADSFKNILAAHMKLQGKLEQKYEQEFNAVDGAAHMLTVLTRQPALVDEFQARSGRWIDWGLVRPFNSANGKALILIAAQKHHTRVNSSHQELKHEQHASRPRTDLCIHVQHSKVLHALHRYVHVPTRSPLSSGATAFRFCISGAEHYASFQLMQA
jgi:hypothetical protein